MTATYDPTNDIGKVRLIIQDRDTENAFFDDAEIQAYLDLNGDSIRRAAADALDSMASNEAYVQKRITLLELSTDGPATAAALRAHAKSLRELADSEDEVDAGDTFDYAEMPETEFQRRERIVKQSQRGEL